MPGLNRNGPMSEGPMTGRGRGLCTGASDPGQRFTAGASGPRQGFTAGGYGSMRRGRGRRRCQAPGWGMGRRQNYGSEAGQFDNKAAEQS
jgi:hypothetical protein